MWQPHYFPDLFFIELKEQVKGNPGSYTYQLSVW